MEVNLDQPGVSQLLARRGEPVGVINDDKTIGVKPLRCDLGAAHAEISVDDHNIVVGVGFEDVIHIVVAGLERQPLIRLQVFFESGVPVG